MGGEWRSSTIGELCDAGILELQTGPFGSQLHAHEYVERGVPVVPTEAIRNRRIDRSLLPQIPQDKAAALRRHLLLKGDILFARRGVQATGQIAYVRAEEEGFICGTGAIRVRVKSAGIVDAEFLSHVLADPAAVRWFKFHAIGATMPNLNESIIRAFSFHLPPLLEQQAIARLLGALDQKIELSRGVRAVLEAMARTLFTSWFLDPVHARAEGNDPGLPPRIAGRFADACVETDGVELPQGWRRQPFAETVTIISGGTPKTTVAEYWDGSIPWFSVADAPEDSDVWVLDTEKKISQAGVEHSATRILPVGTTIISARGTVGRVAMVGTPMAMNQSCYGLRSRSGKYSAFTYFATRYLVGRLRQHAHGSVFSTITRDTFAGISIAVPPRELLERFESDVGAYLERIRVGLVESSILTALRDALLPKLISGALRVRGAERTVGSIT